MRKSHQDNEIFRFAMNHLPGARFSKFTALLVVALFLLTPLSPAEAVHPVSPLPSSLSQASSLLESMTPEERIGQLFLISFQGTDVGSESVIDQLVARYHVGGVVLLAVNDNFVYSGNSSTDTVDQLYAMVRQIQQTEWSASRARQADPNTGEEFLPQFIPLFIATSQEGNGLPYDQILNGLTPLPNAMSMGATWIPSLSEQIGAVLGRELAILGVNLLLGPSLDVLKTPQFKTSNNLGARTFGGDPFWVAEMGRAISRRAFRQWRAACSRQAFSGSRQL
jgi:beta-N-acetylhexosaminidase